MALSRHETFSWFHNRGNRGVTVGNRGGSRRSRYDLAREHIRDTFDDQASGIATGRYAAFRGLKGAAFLDEYLRDPLFSQFFTGAADFATSEPDNDEFERHVRGAAFELMADLYLASHDRSPRVPITGTIAAEVQHILKPDLKVIESKIGQQGIHRQTLYDGFMVQSNRKGAPRAEGAIEATLSSDWRVKKTRQIRGVSRFFEDLRELGCRDPYLIIITPKFAPDGSHDSQFEIVEGQVIERAYVPVSIQYLMKEFFPYLFNEHQIVDSLTLAEQRTQWLASPAVSDMKIGEPAFYRK